ESKGGGHSSTKKGVIPKKADRAKPHGAAGHSQNCECEACCAGSKGVRTHLLLAIKSHPKQDEEKLNRKTGFSIFGRKKGPTPNAVAAMASVERQSSGRVTLHGDGNSDAIAQLHHQREALMTPQEPVTLSNLKQDSLMIPVARMTHFFPAGHPIPSGPTNQGRLRMLETPEPNIHVIFHMLGPPIPITPSLHRPLGDPANHMKECVIKAFKAVVTALGQNSIQGMVLLNLEKGGELG
ncbi:unnamed protein product, partial [Meganyctiphanes norvegica]